MRKIFLFVFALILVLTACSDGADKGARRSGQ
ncbi:lipoprotein [Pseudogracilibacillus sp. SO30301A]